MSKFPVRVYRTVMKSYHLQIPKYDMPLRLRPWFVVFTVIIMLILAFLGFTNFSRSLPLNDKLLHFLCFSIATAVFYFIIDVEEDARRIWFWRHSGLIFTGFICFFCGGILSEIVQSLLPYKEFQIGDVVANLLGSSIGLYFAWHLEKYYRHRREINRLYRPLDTDPLSDDEELDDELNGTQLLPRYAPSSSTGPNNSNSPVKAKGKGSTRLTDVWDEREELFGIGDDSDGDVESGRAPQPQSGVPKITITGS
ncbi:hypothetical protein K435DRAFT_133937 [Dendrothele bispora CBS 962.96]|uniref:VanZ-like domain-containing protein n=1 Tax=Dendrothele bispora (strain CBS 962.96) TaxID=1314807 RepID=A0A4V4HI34_DENBC|nr:hypothetical protein K435DRAFT_133937 [Dendrothele bispora CBS 962.96]